MDEKILDLTVVVPALNERDNIQGAISAMMIALDHYKINGEVVVINDGSTDDTETVVDAMIKKDSRVRMLKHSSPMGIGASFWDGVDASMGNAVVMFPGDNENNPWEICRYYKMLDHVDIVIPFIFNREVRPIFRNALSLIYRFIINTTFLVNFNYTNGTILYRKSVLKELDHRSNGFFFQTDILIRMTKKGYLFAEVPYKIDIRKKGGSKAISFPSLFQVIKGYLHLVRDCYFRKKIANIAQFSDDSVTAQRR